MDSSPLSPIVANWLEKIRKGLDYKKKVFQDDADEAMQFLDGPYDFLYETGAFSGGDDGPDDEGQPARPAFKVSMNKVSEVVQLFGPSLYHRNPNRVVTPKPELTLTPEDVGATDPQSMTIWQATSFAAAQRSTAARTRAKIMQDYLNGTPNELDLKDHSGKSIVEALVKGMGVLWPEIELLADGARVVGSFHDSVDNLVADPDADDFEKCFWIARRCVEPVWKAERDYRLPPGSLRGHSESWNSTFESDPDRRKHIWRQRGETADLITYWKIYSRMGMGGRLSGSVPHPSGKTVLDPLADALAVYGDNVFLVVAEGVPYPLNLPDSFTSLPTTTDDAIKARVQWPAPFYKDRTWPFTEISFHHTPRQMWPVSHIKPAMGQLKFLNWAYSFLMGKIRTTCRDFIAVLKRASPETKLAIQKGLDLTIMEIDEANGEIEKVIQFLQHPPMNRDIFSVIEAVTESFERATGLTALLYGESATQFRSASEAEIKQGATQIRPEDMAMKVEEAMTEAARKEAIVAATILGPRDVLPVIGVQGAFYWGRYISGASYEDTISGISYRIEAGSTRKPNRERFAQNMNQAIQTLFTPLLQLAQATGNTQPVNNLITDWAESIDLDARGYLFTLPPPPPVAPAAGPKPA